MKLPRLRDWNLPASPHNVGQSTREEETNSRRALLPTRLAPPGSELSKVREAAAVAGIQAVGTSPDGRPGGSRPLPGTGRRSVRFLSHRHIPVLWGERNPSMIVCLLSKGGKMENEEKRNEKRVI